MELKDMAAGVLIREQSKQSYRSFYAIIREEEFKTLVLINNTSCDIERERLEEKSLAINMMADLWSKIFIFQSRSPESTIDAFAFLTRVLNGRLTYAINGERDGYTTILAHVNEEV